MVRSLTHRWALLLPAFALATVLVLAASCGGGDDDDGDANGETAAAQTTDDGDEDGGDDDDDDGDDDGGEATEEPTDEPTGGGGGGSAPDVCALLTPDEVADVLGQQVEVGELSDFDPFFSCNWTTMDTFDSVTVSVLTGDDESLEFWYDLSEDAQDVDGLVKRAHFTDLGTLEVLTDDYDIEITVFSDAEGEEALEQAKALAELVLERL